MRKKLVLGIIAAATALALVVGGTLMLFTATTSTATNVVTLGSAKAHLEEKNNDETTYTIEDGSHYHDINTYTKNGQGNWIQTGGNPGDTAFKAPRIVNDGSVPIYVKVDGVFTICKSVTDAGVTTYEPLSATELTTLVNALPTDFLDTLYQSLNIDTDHWSGIGIVANNDGTFTGTWYYTESENGDLLALDPTTPTSDIFTTFTIPNFQDPDINNLLAGLSFQLQLTGYVVQSDNNPYNLNTSNYENAQFPN